MSNEEAPALSNVTYDELEVGATLCTVTEPVSAELAGSLAGAIGDSPGAPISPISEPAISALTGSVTVPRTWPSSSSS